MNELGMPPVRRLPEQVRDRALRTVLTTIDSPPKRRWPPVLAGAAAVAVALSVGTVVALSGPGGPAGLDQLGAGPPITSGNAMSDAALIRCAEAVNAKGRAAEYPPTSQWRVTGVLIESAGENAIAINDAFACFVGESTVYLTSVRGTPAGAVQLAQLTPAIVAVLNPERRAIELDPALFDPGTNSQGVSTAPVQLVSFDTANWSPSSFTISVADSYDGPMPEPAPIALIVHDRPSTSRVVAEPSTLEGCLAQALPGGTVVLRHEVADLPAAWLATAGDSDFALCVMGSNGPVPVAGETPPAEGRTAASIAAVVRDPESGVIGALVAVPPGVTRVEIMTDPQPGRNGVGATCALQDGLAVCTLVENAEVNVVAFDSAGSGYNVPL